MLSTFRYLLPLCASLALACGSTATTEFEESDGSTTDDSSTSGDGSGTDGSGTETSTDDTGGTATEGGTDAIGTTDAPPGDTAMSCPAETCGGVCTETDTDPKNCGACGNVVCHNEACNAGKRVCA